MLAYEQDKRRWVFGTSINGEDTAYAKIRASRVRGRDYAVWQPWLPHSVRQPPMAAGVRTNGAAGNSRRR